MHYIREFWRYGFVTLSTRDAVADFDKQAYSSAPQKKENQTPNKTPTTLQKKANPTNKPCLEIGPRIIWLFLRL